MKRKALFILITGLPGFFACRSELSTKEKEIIQTAIQSHNLQAQQKFSADSIEEIAKLKKSYVIFGLKDTQLLHDKIKTTSLIFSRNYNIPYDLQKDRFLTLKKYLDYCKANYYNPMEHARYMD